MSRNGLMTSSLICWNLCELELLGGLALLSCLRELAQGKGQKAASVLSPCCGALLPLVDINLISECKERIAWEAHSSYGRGFKTYIT